uniref:Uncharacterized protein n=1 Tax=Aegilops tauschii subsp. strangulata TaxID=200361 RepID=A0A453SZM9_AEGTS
LLGLIPALGRLTVTEPTRPLHSRNPAPLDLLFPPTQDTSGTRQGRRCYSGTAAEPS